MAKMAWEASKGPKVCIERSKYITEYLEANNEGDEKLRRAKAVGYYLSHCTPIFFEDCLLAGTMTSKKEGALLYPELNDLELWRDLEEVTARNEDESRLTRDEAMLLNTNIFPYWMERDLGSKFDEKCIEAKIFDFYREQGFCKISEYRGLVPDFRAVLEVGLEKLLQEAGELETQVKQNMPNLKDHFLKEAKEQVVFYESVAAVGSGLLDYADHLKEKVKEVSESVTDEVQKQIYLRLARVCEKVPAKPASSFYEALQCIWFCLIAMGAEYGLDGMSLGRLDQILYPYYREDLVAGKLKQEEAINLIKEFCLKLSWQRLKGKSQLGITIGGVDSNGEDGANSVTHLFLKVVQDLEDRGPMITARINSEVSEAEYVYAASELAKNARDNFLIQDDIENIKTLVGRGISLENSRRYVLMADNVLGIPALSYEGGLKLELDLRMLLNLTLNNGRKQETGGRQWGPLTGEPENFESFEDFLSAFKKQGEWFIQQSILSLELGDETLREYIQMPFTALLFRGCMQRGKDPIASGSIYADIAIRLDGIEQVVSTLSYIEDNVFKGKTNQFSKLLKGREQCLLDYCAKEEMRLKNKSFVITFLKSLLKAYSNVRGGSYYLRIRS